MARRIEISFVLALSLWLLWAPRAHAANYSVAECGWGIGSDAVFDGQSTHFRSANGCSGSPSAMKVLTVANGKLTSQELFGRQIWTAPSGVTITAARGSWWRAAGDHFEQRLMVHDVSGSTSILRRSATARSSGDAFYDAGGNWRTWQNRLTCTDSSGHCKQSPTAWAAVGHLMFTLSDPNRPALSLAGPLMEGGWLRGSQDLQFNASDPGSGVARLETYIDGALRETAEQPCQAKIVDGALRGTRMRPCEAARTGNQAVVTTAFSDGAHTLNSCAVDFAGNRLCSGESDVRFDNSAPASPRGLAVSGGDAWRQANGFDVTWRAPDQGDASPLAGAWYRLRSSAGYDSGPIQAADAAGSLSGIEAPAAGEYELSVWLADGAGNADEANAETVKLRFDDVPPSVAFADERDPSAPERLVAAVSDADSGVASGRIVYRRLGTTDWTALPTDLRDDGDGGRDLVASFPSDSLAPGHYELRAEVTDAAGNSAFSQVRANGSPMIIETPLKAETSLTARMSPASSADGRTARVAYGHSASVAGSLRNESGAPVEGAALQVEVQPDAGSLAPPTLVNASTDSGGVFQLTLPAGPSRSVQVRYAGNDELAAAHTPTLRMSVLGRATLAASRRRLRNGNRLTLSGAVGLRGAAVPLRGKLVQVEFRDRLRHVWRTAGVVRTNGRGAFRFRYRFLSITSPTRILFRARVPVEGAWPYLPAISRSVSVRVTPRR